MQGEDSLATATGSSGIQQRQATAGYGLKVSERRRAVGRSPRNTSVSPAV